MENISGVVPAHSQWKEALTRIWEEAFGDDRERVELFHEYFPVEKHAWCYAGPGGPLSVIYALPALRWEADGSRQPIRYLYAGASRKECRGNGYYGRLLRTLCSDKAQTVLVPVRELIHYYEKLGFVLLENEPGMRLDLKTEHEDENYMDGNHDDKSHAYGNRGEVSHEDKNYVGRSHDDKNNHEDKNYADRNTCSLHEIGAERYKELRELWLGRPGYVEWDLNYLDYALTSCRLDGGLAAEVVVGRESHILLGSPVGGCLVITETSLGREKLKLAGGLIGEIYGCDRAVTRGSLLMAYGNKWEERPYFSIALED